VVVSPALGGGRDASEGQWGWGDGCRKPLGTHRAVGCGVRGPILSEVSLVSGSRNRVVPPLGPIYPLNLLVRLAGSSEAAAIATVQVDSWNATYRGLIPDGAIDQMTVAARTPRWAGAIGSGRVVFVATEDGNVVAFWSVAEGRDAPGPAGEITAMYASPHALGRGHGRLLMQEAIEWFGEQAFLSAVLWVLNTKLIGRTFYERAGWHPDGVEKVDEVLGTFVHHVRYRIDL